ncbi:uncharacterized protein LOC143248220 [Tachypleus tridentatus]|uniref:uncharacterized protein LOC143248220 n=1 Tax=Tachypleus tridentatus TaxID=6853 RepID=UPI003FD6392C
MPYLYIETTKKLCHGTQLLTQGKCNHSLTPSSVREMFPEQSVDAVIYVVVVVVFYTAIIVILVGTNLHRFHRSRCGFVNEDGQRQKRLQSIVLFDDNGGGFKTCSKLDTHGLTSV